MKRLSILKRQNNFLNNRVRISSMLEKYKGVVNVGVGLKEKNNQLTDLICYRVYVSSKIPKSNLSLNEIIPEEIDGFLIDVIERGEYGEIAADSLKHRPLKGGVQIKNDKFTEDDKRGVGTLGYIARLNDGSNKLVGLTCEHVVRLFPGETIVGREVGQPRKVICCCCCTYNVIGKVLNAQKDANVDCAIIELDEDIVEEINNSISQKEILEIGEIRGTETVDADDVLLNTEVKKRGAGTGLTEGKIIDIAFDGNQILIAPNAPDTKFADFGDSGSVVVNSFNNKIIGLLWAAKRDGRAEGVANPIDAVLSAMNITIPSAPPVVGTIAVDSSDTKTHEIASVLPIGPNVRQHFVTAKGTGDIVLKATFDQAVDNDDISWFSLNGDAPIVSPAIGTDKSTAKISRNTPEGLQTMVALFVHGDVVKRVNVWIVWSIGSDTAQRPISATFNPGSLSITAGYDFEFEIQPAEIIPDSPTDDVPDLTGANTVDPPDVPSGDTGVYQKGEDLSTGAVKKWDVTRRLKQKVLNPNGIPIPGDLKFSTTYLNYPSDLIVGNDDKGTADENNDPYTNNKKITSIDDPSDFLSNVLGNVGDTVEYRIHFEEFARLEIGGKWYNISDGLPWRFHMKFKKVSEVDDNTDYNSDGDKTDELWIDDGSDIALDNNGF